MEVAQRAGLLRAEMRERRLSAVTKEEAAEAVEAVEVVEAVEAAEAVGEEVPEEPESGSSTARLRTLPPATLRTKEQDSCRRRRLSV